MNLDHLEREIEDAEMLLSRDVYTRGQQHHVDRNDKENRVKDITDESKKLSKRERSVRFFFSNREFTHLTFSSPLENSHQMCIISRVSH
jgi:hypothetical protein